MNLRADFVVSPRERADVLGTGVSSAGRQAQNGIESVGEKVLNTHGGSSGLKVFPSLPQQPVAEGILPAMADHE